MKEITTITKDQVQIVKQVQQKKQHKLIGSIVPESGHTCFEFNRKTLELRKAEFKPVTAAVYGKPVNNVREVETKEYCVYITALNAENAVRKLLKKYPRTPYIKEIIE